ncbi:MAG: sugar phosphate isomerase/epimerase [Clostridia bacterium]|nr:sugar phosphate isomerase/epimerase [Clostridia bacterium]
MKIGVQFYTLREKCETLEGLSESLKRVADMGYTTVQISGVCPYEAEWLRDELKKNSLECVLTHWNGDEIKQDPVSVINKHNIFSCKNIGLGCMPGGPSEENLYKFLEEFPSVAKTVRENGSKLFYHHHHWEFGRCADGERMIDKILRTFSPEELGITVDTYWAQYSGADSAEFIERLKGRCECIHVKDFEIVGSEQRMASVGHGNINFERVIASAESAGANYLLVEQDNCYGADPFECLKNSYEYLKSLGLN